MISKRRLEEGSLEGNMGLRRQAMSIRTYLKLNEHVEFTTNRGKPRLAENLKPNEQNFRKYERQTLYNLKSIWREKKI